MESEDDSMRVVGGGVRFNERACVALQDLIWRQASIFSLLHSLFEMAAQATKLVSQVTELAAKGSKVLTDGFAVVARNSAPAGNTGKYWMGPSEAGQVGLIPRLTLEAVLCNKLDISW